MSWVVEMRARLGGVIVFVCWVVEIRARLGGKRTREESGWRSINVRLQYSTNICSTSGVVAAVIGCSMLCVAVTRWMGRSSFMVYMEASGVVFEGPYL